MATRRAAKGIPEVGVLIQNARDEGRKARALRLLTESPDHDFKDHFDRAAYGFFMRYGVRHEGRAQPLGLHDFLSRFERAVMFETLARTQGSQKQAADLLHLKKQTLSMKLKKQKIHIAKIPV